MVVARSSLPRTVILLGVASLLGDVGSEMIFPLLPVFLTGTLGASSQFLGLVEGIADTVAAILKLVSGAVSDRIGRKKALVASGYTLAALARPVIAIATAPWQVLSVRVVDRVGKGLRTSPRDALLAESVDNASSGRAFGFHRAMDHSGAVLGPLVATLLLGVGLSMRSVFALAAIPGLLSVGAVLLVREKRAEPVAPGSAAAAPVEKKGRLTARFLGLLAVLTLFYLGHPSDAFLILRARDVGMDPARIPLLWSAFHVAKVLLVNVGGRLADRFDRARLLASAFIVSALAYVAFAVVNDVWVTFGLFLVYAVYYGLSEPTERALVKELAPEGARGRAYGWYNFLVGGSALPAGLMMGALWDHFGATVALGAGAGCGMVAALLLFLWRHTAVTPAPSPL